MVPKARVSEYHSLPTQCFFDVILIPLCTWVYLVLTTLLSRVVVRKSFLDRIPAYQHKNLWTFLPILIAYYVILCAIRVLKPPRSFIVLG
jgi:hypothetical protein